MASLFSAKIDPRDNLYLYIRDRDDFRDIKEWLEGLWASFEPYADRHFREQIAVSFQDRFWEMYLAVALIERGYEIDSYQNGPDFCFNLDDKKCWIEATSPKRGCGPDAVEEQRFTTDNEKPAPSLIPSDDILLRFSNSIKEKHKKHLEYVNNNIVSRKDIYVIAINGCGPGYEILDMEDAPRFTKILYGYGDMFVTFDKRTMKTIRSGFWKRQQLNKKSGSHVEADYFQSDKYACISGVLYSGANIGYYRADLGCDFKFAHNHKAVNPLPEGWIKKGREYCFKLINKADHYGQLSFLDYS